jgi:hypothetical protein
MCTDGHVLLLIMRDIASVIFPSSRGGDTVLEVHHIANSIRACSRAFVGARRVSDRTAESVRVSHATPFDGAGLRSGLAHLVLCCWLIFIGAVSQRSRDIPSGEDDLRDVPQGGERSGAAVCLIYRNCNHKYA